MKKLKIFSNEQLNSFINGIKQDYEAIKNSLTYMQSNGVAEALVNKTK